MENLLIAMACDVNYLPLAACSLCSLLENNKEFDKVTIYFIESDIPTCDLQNLFDMVAKYKNATLIIIDAPKPDNRISIKGTLNYSTFYRLLLSSLLPGDVDKVLYLDCDTLVLGSLKYLWNEQLIDYSIAGVLDTVGFYAKKAIGLQKNDIYINAGVVLINLKQWRNSDLEKRFLSTCSLKIGKSSLMIKVSLIIVVMVI